MKTLNESSLLKEAARISKELIADKGVSAPVSPNKDWPKVRLAKAVTYETKSDGLNTQPAAITPTSDKAESPDVYQEEQLENTLVTMCKRGGFNSAVIADKNGFPMAAYNSPVKDENIVAFTSVLGVALEGAGNLLDDQAANHITLDINYTDKASLRLFHINDEPYFLMVICPQEVDEKVEVELSIERIITILK